MKTLMKCHRMRHFIMVCTVCLDKNNLKGQIHINLEIQTCHPLRYIMDDPMHNVINMYWSSLQYKRVDNGNFQDVKVSREIEEICFKSFVTYKFDASCYQVISF